MHLWARDTSFAVVSRAPYTRILPFKARMGWTVPWYSAYGRGLDGLGSATSFLDLTPWGDVRRLRARVASRRVRG